MSVDYVHTIQVDRPASQMFELLANAENNPRWQDGMVSCAFTSEPPIGVGSTYAQQAKFLWKRIDTHFEVTEFVPGERISIESTVSTFPIQVTRSVTALDEGRCEVRAHVRGQPTGVLKLFSGMVAKSVSKDYARLKELAESGAFD